MMPNNKTPKIKKSQNSILTQALKYHNQGDLVKAKDSFLRFYKIHPDYSGLKASLAKVCIQLSQYDEGLHYIIEELKLNPNDPNTLTSCAFIQVQMGLLEDAFKNINLAIDIDPEKIESQFVLCSILTAQGDDQAALTVALNALSIDPTSANALNNLGTVLQKNGDSMSAKIAFESACILSPESHEPFYNLACLEAIADNPHKAIELFNKSLLMKSFTTSNIKPRVMYSLSFEFLKIGRLSEGWKNYNFGFHESVPFEYRRAPNRTFSVPEWKGEPLSGQRLLIWGEQGIGDLLSFLTCLADLDAIDGYVLVECEPRLVVSLGRSFPKIIFRASSYYQTQGLPPVFNDYNLHIPMGSLMGIFRNDISDFKNSKPYIIVDSEKANYFEEKLNSPQPARRRIGICWRSGKLSGQRNANYTSLLDWGSIFALPNCDFINLQYGECEDELVEAEDKFGVKILRWSELDLKNDFESTFALMSRLDTVVTVGTAVSMMAASIGVSVILMEQRNWGQLGTDRYPWFENVEVILPPKGGIVAECLTTAANIISK